MFEIHAVGLDLSWQLLEQDPQTQSAPAGGVGEPGKGGAEVPESQGFSGQVRIRRKVTRQVRLDIRPLLDQALQDPPYNGRGQPAGPSKTGHGPQPCDAS